MAHKVCRQCRVKFKVPATGAFAGGGAGLVGGLAFARKIKNPIGQFLAIVLSAAAGAFAGDVIDTTVRRECPECGAQLSALERSMIHWELRSLLT